MRVTRIMQLNGLDRPIPGEGKMSVELLARCLEQMLFSVVEKALVPVGSSSTDIDLPLVPPATRAADGTVQY